MMSTIKRGLALFGFEPKDGVMILNVFKLNLGDRYLGSSLGLVWAVLGPLMLLGIFCFVFSFVFPGRLPGRDGSLPFLLWLISGYAPWLGISEGLTSATSSVVSNTGIIKNISFKSEILPIVGSIMGLVPMGVGFAILFALSVGTPGAFGVQLVVLPFVIILQLLFIAGLGLFLAALNVFVRDTALILPNVLTALLFASPIFYPLSSYPSVLRPVLAYNPFYVLAELYRAPLIEGTFPATGDMAYLSVVSLLLFVGGLAWFRRLKPFFDMRL
jgi:lipopolysaccharide transport system permease protein